MGIFEAVDNSLRNENFLDFIPGVTLDLGDEFLFSFDDFLVFAVSGEF